MNQHSATEELLEAVFSVGNESTLSHRGTFGKGVFYAVVSKELSMGQAEKLVQLWDVCQT
jgi:hypothetical protein